MKKYNDTHGGFSPEEKQLLGGAHLDVVDGDRWPLACGRLRRVNDSSLEKDEGYGGDAAPRRLERTKAPVVFAIKATG